MDAQRIFEQLMEDFMKAGIPLKKENIDPKLQYSRSLTRLGQCNRKIDPRTKKERYTIILSQHAMKDENQIRNTLAHELIHTLPRCMNHGKTFHKYGNLVEEKLGIAIDAKATKEESKNSGIEDAYVEHANYKMVCQGCGYEFYRQKMSPLIRTIVNTPERVTCKNCGKHFKAYKINRR